MPNYDKMSLVTKSLTGREVDRYWIRSDPSDAQEKLATVDDLTDEELMLTPPNLFGFSLADKEWRKQYAVYSPLR